MNPNTFALITKRFFWRIAPNVWDEADEDNRRAKVKLEFRRRGHGYVWDDDDDKCRDLVERYLMNGLGAWDGSSKRALWVDGTDDEGRDYEIEITMNKDQTILINCVLEDLLEDEDEDEDEDAEDNAMDIDEDPINYAAPAA